MVGERALTSWLAEHFATPRRDVRVGIGDDGAVVRPPGGDLVVTCDPVVEGVHFDSAAPAAAVGRKAVHRSLSDLAAMGAVADWLVVSALLPPGLSSRRRRSLFDGVRDAAALAKCAVIGGDVAATSGPLILTVTGIGHLRGRPLQRSGARPGDTLHVTGPLGGASLGHHLRFRPHLAEGQWLARQPNVTAAMDVSDGLLLDLHTLLIASGGLGAELWSDQIPVSPDAVRLARRDGTPPLEHALGDGEDHVLLFAMKARSTLPRGGPLNRIARQPFGRVMKAPGLRLIDESGAVREVEPQGFEHQL